MPVGMSPGAPLKAESSFLLADGAVNRLTQKAGVAGVAGGLLDEVH